MTTCLIKLEELAFMAIYRSVVSQLLSVPAHHKRNIRKTCCISDPDAPPKTSTETSDPTVQQIARQLIDSKASGIKSREIRLKLLKHFSQEEESSHLRLSSFLDVILDESFDELNLSFFEEDDPFDDQILPTIARRCPSVSTLNMTFSSHLTEECSHIVHSLASSLVHLQQLSSLNLSKLPTECKSMASLLGRYCPVLQKLRIDLSDDSFTTKEILAIFYAGEMSRLSQVATVMVDDPSQRKAYHRCQVSRKALHPFCQTLEDVRINCIEDDNPYVIAFILRHLPRLKELETSDFEFRDYSASIRVLWDIWDPSVGVSTVRCIEPHPLIPDGTAHASIFDVHPDLIVQSHFTGSLSLVDLFMEGDIELKTIKAVCDLCPNVYKILLLEAGIRFEDRSAEAFNEEHIMSLFRRLKQLRVFTCTDSDGPLSTNITRAVAPFLTTLELSLDGDFVPKFDFLTECINLQVLKLSPEFHPPLKNYFNHPVDRQRFLLKLEEIQLDFCMNAELEELFLKKNTLKHVDVLCLHHLGKTDNDLFELFLQWPQLVSFKYKMPRKFTVEMVLKLLPHLPQLRSLSLYKDIKHRCLADFHLLKKACRVKSIKLDLQLFLDTYLCIDGEINDELISTSDESETECI